MVPEEFEHVILTAPALASGRQPRLTLSRHRKGGAAEGEGARMILLSLRIFQRARPPPRGPFQAGRIASVNLKRERKNAMATLSVLKFNDPSGADRVLL